MSEINEPQRELDLGQALVFLEKAVGDKGPDYIYEVDGIDPMAHVQQYGHSLNCRYFNKGQPSCIVGHMLSYMGYTPQEVEGVEGENAQTAMDRLGIEADAETKHLIREVQISQDYGSPWGEALNKARGLE